MTSIFSTLNETTTSEKKDFKVVGYYADWNPDHFDQVQFDILTHLIYAFAVPQKDGIFHPLRHPNLIHAFATKAHESHKKMLLAVGGYSKYDELPLEPVLKAATDSDEKIAHLVENILKLVEEYQVDGVAIDWVYPRYHDVTQFQYEKLMLALSKALKQNNLLIATTVLAAVNSDGDIVYDAAAFSDAVINCVDWIHVVAYDGDDGENHSPFEFAVNCCNYWKNTRKVPAEKIILGVPFYGRPSWIPYCEILEVNPNGDQTDVSVINQKQVHYNATATMQKKAKWAKENVGGIMIWELAQDTQDKQKSLLCAIDKALK